MANIETLLRKLPDNLPREARGLGEQYLRLYGRDRTLADAVVRFATKYPGHFEPFVRLLRNYDNYTGVRNAIANHLSGLDAVGFMTDKEIKRPLQVLRSEEFGAFAMSYASAGQAGVVAEALESFRHARYDMAEKLLRIFRSGKFRRLVDAYAARPELLGSMMHAMSAQYPMTQKRLRKLLDVYLGPEFTAVAQAHGNTVTGWAVFEFADVVEKGIQAGYIQGIFLEPRFMELVKRHRRSEDAVEEMTYALGKLATGPWSHMVDEFLDMLQCYDSNFVVSGIAEVIDHHAESDDVQSLIRLYASPKFRKALAQAETKEQADKLIWAQIRMPTRRRFRGAVQAYLSGLASTGRAQGRGLEDIAVQPL